MSSSKNLTSSKRLTQSKTLTVTVIEKDKFKVAIQHSIFVQNNIKTRKKTYILDKAESFADRILFDYLHTKDWGLNLIRGQFEVSRDYVINNENDRKK